MTLPLTSRRAASAALVASLAIAGAVVAADRSDGNSAAASGAGSVMNNGDTALTIYSSALPGAIPADFYRPVPGGTVPAASSVPGYAMVRQDRDVNLSAGRSTLRFNDVAGLIDPTTVKFTVPANPAVRVLEQNFQFDLVSTAKLMLRYLDKSITVERNVGSGTNSVTGTLLSAGDGVVLRSSDGSIHALNGYSSVTFPELPGGLITQPTLVWEINSPLSGTQRARVSYQTGGITWWADYNAVFSEGRDANNGLLDLSAWVSVINQSGASYPEARLKLVAGEVNRVEPRPMRVMNMAMAKASLAEADGGFAEKAFDEFHLYTLGRRTTLPNNSTKQIELFEQTRQIPAKRLLVYDPLGAQEFGSPMTERDPGIIAGAKVASFVPWHSAAGRSRARRAPRRRRRKPGIHRRGCDRSHTQGRDRAPQARQRLRCGGRAPPGRFHRECQRTLARRRDRNQAAQPQVTTGGSGGEGAAVPLEQLEAAQPLG
jgi:hypothetical protein